MYDNITIKFMKNHSYSHHNDSLLCDLEKDSSIELEHLKSISEVSVTVESTLQQKPIQQNNYYLGVLCIIVCVIGYTVMSFITKLLFIANPELT